MEAMTKFGFYFDARDNRYFGPHPQNEVNTVVEKLNDFLNPRFVPGMQVRGPFYPIKWSAIPVVNQRELWRLYNA